MSKICKKCGQEKSIDSFHKDSKMKDRHKSVCKSCKSIRRHFHSSLSIARKRFDKNLNSAIYRSLKTRKGGTWERIFGFTLEMLIKHLEAQFTSNMSWKNYGSYWWVDKIIPRAAYKYQNIKNNEFHKCWSLKNLRPLSRYECVRKGDKVIKDLIEQYNLFDIMPIGLIVLDNSKETLLRNELTRIMKQFVDQLENHKNFDKDLYIRMIDISTAWNKAEILGVMVDKIRIFQDYEEDEINFDYKPFVDMLLP